MPVPYILCGKTRSYNICKLQVPIKAGHEFIVTTDPKYAECGDDKHMYVDYVRNWLLNTPTQ